MRDCRHVLSETSCLTCVGIGRSDSRHKTDSSLHAITKVPRILENATVLMMGINKGVKESPSPQYQIEGFARTPESSSHGEGGFSAEVQ